MLDNSEVREVRTRDPVVQRLHPPATDDSSNGVLDGVKRRVDGSLNRSISPNDDNARQAAQDSLDGADLVDSATRSIQVGDADADSLDGSRELPEPRAELLVDIGLVVFAELDADRSHVRRR